MIERILSRLVIALILSVFGVANQCRAIQDSGSGFTRSQMVSELDRLAKICDNLGLDSQGKICRTWLAPPRSDLHRLFLPASFPTESGKKEIDAWRNHFINARKKYADHLYLEAQAAIGRGDETKAYRLLWQTLREHPEHVEAKRVLGPLLTPLTSRPQQKTNTKVNELAALGNVTRWQSPNFALFSRATPKESLELATQLEQFHILWTQVFYELWAPKDLLKRRMSGGNDPWPDYERMKVVLLANRAEYLKLLGGSEENIGVSVGYYNPTMKLSIFYLSDDLDDTLHHELTHQLFSEASSVDGSTVLEKAEGAWCIEGLALYMESLTQREEGWTVGGLDASRLQTARYRALRDEYWPLWDSWCKGSLLNWKASTDISLMYSHATGLTHLFMDILPEQTGARQIFLEYVRSVYAGKQNSTELLKLLGGGEQAAQATYRKSMTITDKHLELLAGNTDQVRQLVLCRSQIENWETLAKFTQLKWLDLSFSNISKEKLAALQEMSGLQRLSLEGTKLDSEVMPLLAKLKKLNDLDLSLCAIEDSGLAALVSHPSLETLWLTGTKVTEKSFPTLSTMPKLSSCDVGSTVITNDAWDSFLSKHPKLQKKK